MEDRKFMMDAFLANFRSTDNSNEYFSITGRYFGVETIAAALAREIQENGSATLRTDYMLDDMMFNEIAMEVMQILDTTDLYGFHWLGVVWMSDSGV